MIEDYEFEIGIFENILRRNPKDRTVIELLSGLYPRAGRLNDGLKMDRKLVRLDPDNPTAHYNLACSLALKKRKKDAVEALNLAIAKGFHDFEWLSKDPDLNALREHPDFVALLKKFNKPK